jgi:hypothetical protein
LPILGLFPQPARFGLKYLGTGDAATTMGAIEYLTGEIKRMANAMELLAEAHKDRTT